MEIRRLGDPVLRARAKPVRTISKKVRQLLDEMAKTMYENSGVGLAAPQVGELKRVIVVDVGEGLIELINPEIVSRSGTQTATEGCLSIPGIVGEVERWERVEVVGLDRHGRKRWVEGTDLLSRALQHEIDHLDGILFIDKATNLREVSAEAKAGQAVPEKPEEMGTGRA